METKICIRCGKEKPLNKFKLAWKGRRGLNAPGYEERNPSGVRRNQCSACRSRRAIAKYKLDFLRAFDYRCSCCGERQPFFLTLDHKKNDGAQHRRTKNQVSILLQARREGFDKKKWDCLCLNCNFAKGHYGVCPHRLGKSADDVLAELRASCKHVGRKHHDSPSRFREGFDERRMQRDRRVLKPCPYCAESFGSNEMVRHKRNNHRSEMAARRKECLKAGRQNTLIRAHGTPASVAESAQT